MLAFIIWNFNPEVTFWGANIRYYGLTYVLGFVIAYFVLRPIFRKEGKDFFLTIKLMWAIVIGTLIGGRLGHCFFYEAAYYLKKPLEVLTHWNSGVASHGAAIGILIGLVIYSKYVAKTTLLWSFDRALLVLALGAALVRIGNLSNSEIYGYPTQGKTGFVFVRDTKLARAYHNHKGFAQYIEQLNFSKRHGEPIMDGKAYPFEIKLSLLSKIKTEEMANNLVNQRVLPMLRYGINSKGQETNIFIDENQTAPFELLKEGTGFLVKINAYCMPKHPTQLYEALVYILLFVLLMYLYHCRGVGSLQGLMSGVFLVVMFTSRFFLEFLKQNQVAKEEDMMINMGQQLSIPFVVLGIGFIYWAVRNR